MINKMLISIFLVYVTLFVMGYFFGDHLAFFPPRSSYSDNKQIIKLKTADGATISAVYLPNKKAKYTILASHGNAEDIGQLGFLYHKFNQMGFSVFAYDYHGYGTSEGKPTEKNVYLDIDAAYAYATKILQIPPEKIIAYGNSIGAAVAIDLAARKQVAGVILQSPFLSGSRVITQLKILPFDKFDNLTKIKNIHHPILIIHGTNDAIVPFWQGKKLFAKLNQPKYFFAVKNAGHNDLLFIAGESFWSAIDSFVRKLS